MSAATFASYVIGKLSGSDRVDAATSSMASRTPPTPRLTAVWRTKSIPYDVPRTEPHTFKSDGSLLRILRAKSMPSLNLEDEIPGRSLRPMSPLSIGSPVSSRSASPLPMVRSKTLNPRLDRNTVTPPPSPSLSNPAFGSPPQRRRLERTTSDGALLVKRRQKRSEFENEFPSGGTPSVRALKNVFDAKSNESVTSDRSPLSPKGKWPLPSPTKSVEVASQALKTEPEAATRQVKPVRHGSLEHYERGEEKKTKEIGTSQPSFKEILRRFQQPDKLEKEATTLQAHKLPRETARQVNIIVVDKALVREVQSEPKPKAHVPVSRQRSKSEPEPNTKRPHVLASPVSVKRLKMQFESQGVKDSFASPILLPPRREATKLRKQFAVRHSSSESEDDVFDMDLPCAVKKPEPVLIETTEASSVTPSVSNLRQQFEKAASAQSFSKTVGRDDVTVRRIQWSTTQDLRAPFESAEQNKEVQRERPVRPSLSEINTHNTVKNLLQQFQTTTPDQPVEEMTNKFSFEVRETPHSKEVSNSDVKSYIKSYEASSSPQTRHRNLDGEESEPRPVESLRHGVVTQEKSPVQRHRSSSSSSDDSTDSQEPDELLLSVKRGSAERDQQIEDYWRNKEETLVNRRKEEERSYGYRDETDADRLENEKLLQKQRLTHLLHSESEEEDNTTSGEDEARGQHIDIKEEIRQMETLVKEALAAPSQTNKAEDTHSKIDTLITDFEKNQKQDGRVRSSSVLSEDLGLESSHGKVGHLIDKFANVRDADSDGDSSDGEGKGDRKKSSATRSEETALDASPGKVGHLIDKFAKVRTDSISEDDDKDKADKEPRERKESDITSLIDKFAKINHPRVKSTSTSSDSDAEKPPAAEKEKPPVPTIPTKSIPGKVRTLNPDELRFFGMGGSSEPFVRSQSLRVKKADPQPFYPRGGSLRVKKSEPLPVIPAAKKLPRNCRNLKPDELRFFDMGNNNNVYSNLTSKSNSQNSSCASTPTTEKEDAFNNNNNKTPNDVQFFQ